MNKIKSRNVLLQGLLHLLIVALVLVAVCFGRDLVWAGTTGNNISCFVYHRFGEAKYPSTSIDLDTFARHLRYLKDNDVDVITLGEALQLIREKKRTSKRTVVLTIDDGYESFVQNGMPLLRQYGFRATVFVNTANVGTNGYVNWPELRDLHAEGIEIGNHSHSHAHFVNVEESGRAAFFRSDLETSQQIFLAELGVIPRLFSYPYGEYTADMVEILKDKGFVAAAAQNSGVISPFSNAYALPRFPMGGSYAQLESFKRKTAMLALPTTTLDRPGHLVTEDNPPVLRLQLHEPEKLQTEHLQCFVADGRECSLHYDQEQGIVAVRSSHPLQARRTLYTVTVPSAVLPGGWHWFSHVWIVPHDHREE